MNKLDFKRWLTADYRTSFYENFAFGPKTPTHQLKWIMENSSRAELGDAFYLEIKEALVWRSFAEAVEPPSQPAGSGRKWIYSKIIKALGEFQPDDDVGVAKAREGVWEVQGLDSTKRTFTSQAELANYVKSVRDGASPITAGSIEELRTAATPFRTAATAAQPVAAQPVTAQPTAAAKTYVLAHVLKPFGKFKENDRVAVSKSDTDGAWDVAMLDRPDVMTSLSKSEVPIHVKSVKTMRDDKEVQVTASSIEELQALVKKDEPEKKPEKKEEKPAEKVHGRLPPEKMSKYNREIEESFRTSGKNIVINALAGTGKTTMLKHIASYKKPGEKWLYLVFNKKNQIEATKVDSETQRTPFPAGVEVLTTHSFLGRVLSNNARTGKMEKTELFDGKSQSPKMSSIIDDPWFKGKAESELGIKWDKIWPLKMRVKNLASLAKAFNVHPGRDREAMEMLDSLIDKYSIDTTLLSDEDREEKEEAGQEIREYRDEIVDMAYDVLRRMVPKGSKEKHYNTSRDHDDTLWWAAMHADEINWPHYDVVLADEVQDFNKCQQVMLKKLNDAGARIVAVGDPWQAIYRFRGADNDAFNNVESILNGGRQGGTTHMLPINYRSGTKIIKYANDATHMKGLPEDKQLKAGMSHEGEVSTHKMYSDVMDTIETEWDKKKELTMPTAILARNNAPLLSTAMSLLKRGIPFQIIGREFLEEITKFIKSITGIGKRATNPPVEQFRDQMNDYVEEKQEAWRGKIKKQGELEEMTTIADSLNGVMSYLEEHGWKDPNDRSARRIGTALEFVDFLKSRFGGLNVQDNVEDAEEYERRKDRMVTITTGHRSKGLEFDRVFIIRNDLYDAPKGTNEEEIQQERNGQYVAYTRARKELHVINDKEP